MGRWRYEHKPIERTDSMNIFAKLFHFVSIGQILVKIDDEDNGPEVRLYFVPDGLGVCSVALTFEADETGDHWDKAQKAFDMIDSDKAESIVKNALKTMPVGLAGES